MFTRLDINWRSQLYSLSNYFKGKSPLYSVERIQRLGASLDAVERRNVSCTSWESNPDFSVVQPVGWYEEKQNKLQMRGRI
jgi:hypothetical protein